MQSTQRKSHVLKSLQHYIIMDINKLSGKIIGAAIYDRRYGSNCNRIKGNSSATKAQRHKEELSI